MRPVQVNRGDEATLTFFTFPESQIFWQQCVQLHCRDAAEDWTFGAVSSTWQGLWGKNHSRIIQH